MYPQRDISLSRWQGDEENFSLRVDPPLQFCSKLLYIYYKFWGIIWFNESKISSCQLVGVDFVFPLSKKKKSDPKIFEGRVNPQRDISFSRWQQDDENFSLRIDPLQFCSKLLYIYYKLWGLFWLYESKISICQRDDKNLDQWEYLFVSLNTKIQQQKYEISFTALKFFESLESVGLPACTLGAGQRKYKNEPTGKLSVVHYLAT